MSASELSRRGLLGLGVSLLGIRTASARGRLAIGGRLSFRLPWPVTSVDPHRLEDGTAAILGDALFDSLYARDESGAFVPSLAEADPEPDGAMLRVRLRTSLRSAKGRPIEARDAAAALARSRSLGGRAWLADVPAPRVDGRTLVFAMRDASRLVRALASPLVAMVPAGFTPESPDGTGPMKLVARADGAALVRNFFAARGPSLLDEVALSTAPDLAASLRAFESGTDDLGWLGSGLHEPRPGSKPFDLGAVAWAVLFTGRDAGAWDAPGVAQRLCDGIPPARLSYLALGPAWTPEPEQGWGGPEATLLVRDDAPWLVELARAIAATISRAGHAVTARPVPLAELTQRRTSKAFALLLDVVRPLAPGSVAALVALATADGAPRASDLVQRPPRLGEVPARTVTRTLHCGVVGDVRVQGGRAGDVLLAPSAQGAGFDLAATSRVRR
ncbi:MAG: Oligopeptide transporter, periplasmic oligopeptide-binding protein OppA [Labilithrix sp.]|nr:Oligopeptide transporter, periplasmic oligopeptide-binding protein OppA [Labilithrix sp.]